MRTKNRIKTTRNRARTLVHKSVSVSVHVKMRRPSDTVTVQEVQTAEKYLE